MSEPFLGQVVMFAGNFAPRGWALCNGQIMPITQNTALFSLLGVNYGGNGQTNFGLPNLQSLVPIGYGQGPGLSPYNIGEIVGSEGVMLSLQSMPSHNHAATAGSSGNQLLPTNNYWAADSAGAIAAYSDQPPAGRINQQAILPTGGNMPHENRQPLLALTFIIALEGVFPARQ